MTDTLTSPKLDPRLRGEDSSGVRSDNSHAPGARILIRKAAVLGAGVMGAQIAAHLANANVKPILFDLPAKEGRDKSAIANKAIAALAKQNPAPLSTGAVLQPNEAAIVAVSDEFGVMLDERVAVLREAGTRGEQQPAVARQLLQQRLEKLQ